MESVYILDWKRTGTGLVIDEISPEDGKRLLLPNVLSLNRSRKHHVNPEEASHQLSGLSGRVKWYRIRGGVDITELCRLMKPVS